MLPSLGYCREQSLKSVDKAQHTVWGVLLCSDMTRRRRAIDERRWQALGTSLFRSEDIHKVVNQPNN